MRIVKNNKIVTFDYLEVGDVFQYNNDTNEPSTYIKLDNVTLDSRRTYNALNLHGMFFHYFENDTEVINCPNAKLVIE